MASPFELSSCYYIIKQRIVFPHNIFKMVRQIEKNGGISLSKNEIVFTSFDELISALLPNGSIGKKLSGYIYRGEGSEKYKLLPSALREENIGKFETQTGFNYFKLNETEWLQIFSEYRSLKNFYIIANNSGLKVHGPGLMLKHYFDTTSPEFLFRKYEITWIEPEIVELAALAQHYGVLTRMIDWSSDLLVALYFACVGSMKKILKGEDDSMVVWALNAANIQVNEQHIYTMGKDTCPLKIVVPPYYANANLNAQKGVLTYWKVTTKRDEYKEVDRTPLDELIKSIPYHHRKEKNLLYKFKLSNKFSPEVYKWLKYLGVSAARIYPGYDGIVRQMEEDKMYQATVSMLNTKT